MANIEPVIGNWYKNRVTREIFEIVATDEDTRSIEIQHFEGEVAEIDADDWWDLELAELPPPEDWSGPFDDLEKEEIEIDGSANGLRRVNPLDQFD